MRELSNVEWSNQIRLHDYIPIAACSECLCHRFSTSPLAPRASNSDKAASVNYLEFIGMVYNSTPHSPEEENKNRLKIRNIRRSMDAWLLKTLIFPNNWLSQFGMHVCCCCSFRVSEHYHRFQQLDGITVTPCVGPTVCDSRSCASAHCSRSTLRASLSGTFLQTLPDLVTPLKGHSLSPRSCSPSLKERCRKPVLGVWSAPSERFGY